MLDFFFKPRNFVQMFCFQRFAILSCCDASDWSFTPVPHPAELIQTDIVHKAATKCMTKRTVQTSKRRPSIALQV